MVGASSMTHGNWWRPYLPSHKCTNEATVAKVAIFLFIGIVCFLFFVEMSAYAEPSHVFGAIFLIVSK